MTADRHAYLLHLVEQNCAHLCNTHTGWAAVKAMTTEELAELLEIEGVVDVRWAR